ncbi:MAG: hypothetical protein WC329_05900, partial [Candidatus Omnitrophota bacterium]
VAPGGSTAQKKYAVSFEMCKEPFQARKVRAADDLNLTQLCRGGGTMSLPIPRGRGKKIPS